MLQFNRGVVMHKLFALSYRRILARLNQQDLNASSAHEALSSNNIPPFGEGFLYRLPRQELKHILNIPCPINSLQDSNSEQIIASSKRLRQHGKLKEEKICGKCPFKANCKVAKQPSSQQLTNTPLDLLIYWSALDKLNKPEDLYFRQWVSAYKLGDNIITSLGDLASGAKQTEQYNRLRLQAIKAYEERPKEQTGTEGNLSLQERKVFQELASKYDWQNQSIQKEKKQSKAEKKQKNLNKSDLKDIPREQQVLGRDFSFDEEEEFQPVHKFSKDNYTEPKPEKSYKNKKGYQTIEKRQAQNYNNSKPYPPKSYQKQRYSNEDEVPNSRQYQRQPKQQRQRYRQDNYSKQQRYREQEGQYSQPQRPYKQGKKYVEEYQPEERQKYVKYGQRQPIHKEKMSQHQHPPKNTKPSPFVSRWQPGQETFEAERPKKGKTQEKYHQQYQPRDRQTDRTPKQQKPQKTENANNPPRAQRQQKSERQAPRIIEVEQIDERQMGMSRPGRAIRRRGRSQPTTIEQ